MLDCSGSQKNGVGKQTVESSTNHSPCVKPRLPVTDASGANNERVDKKLKNSENGKCGVVRSVVTISAVKMSTKVEESDSSASPESGAVEQVSVRTQPQVVNTPAVESLDGDKLASSKTSQASDGTEAKQKTANATSESSTSKPRAETSVVPPTSSIGTAEAVQLANSLGSWAPFEFLDIANNQQVRVGVRVSVPIADHPHVNFIGKLLGPKGNTLKRLQQACGTRIAILGRGSMKDAREEERCRNSGLPKYAHLHYDTHVLVEAVAAPADAYEAIGTTLRALEPYISPLAAMRTGDNNQHRQAAASEVRNAKPVQVTALAASVNSAASSSASSPATPSERARRYVQCPNYGYSSTSNSSATKTTATAAASSGCGESPRASPGTCYAGTSASTASASNQPTPSSTSSHCTMQMQQTNPSAYVNTVGYETLADCSAAGSYTASYQAAMAYQNGWGTFSPYTYVSSCEPALPLSSANANATAGASTGVNSASVNAGAQQRSTRASSGATSNPTTATARRYGTARNANGNSATTSRGVNNSTCSAQDSSTAAAGATASSQRKMTPTSNGCESPTPRDREAQQQQQQQQLLAQQSFTAYAPPLMLKPVNYANAYAYPSATGSFAQLGSGMYAQGAVGYAHQSLGYYATPNGANSLGQTPLQQFTPGSYSQQTATANAFAQQPNTVAYVQVGTPGGFTQQGTALAVGTTYSISAKVAEYEAYLYNQLAAHYMRDPNTVTAMISYWSALYAQALQDEYCPTSPSGNSESTSNSAANGNTYCSITYQPQQYAPTMSSVTPDTDGQQMATTNSASDSTGAAGSSSTPPDGRSGTPTASALSPGSAWVSQSQCPQFTLSASNTSASGATWR